MFFFCEFMELDFVSVHKHTKKELGQYPAILTSHLVNNPYILLCSSESASFCHYDTTSNLLPNVSGKKNENLLDQVKLKVASRQAEADAFEKFLPVMAEVERY